MLQNNSCIGNRKGLYIIAIGARVSFTENQKEYQNLKSNSCPKRMTNLYRFDKLHFLVLICM